MEQGQLSWIANFIWGIADDVLRDLYVRGKYRDVILPMTVLRRLDVVLEPTKPAVRDMKASLDRAGIVHQDAALRQAAGQAFYNTSKFTLRDLKARASQEQLKADFEAYLDGFSPNVQDILENFEFRNQIPRLSKADALGTLIEKLLSPDINLSPNPVLNGDGSVKHAGLDNHGMGTVFEELVRRFNEENNEEAGEHWTPRDAVKLMAKLIFLPIADKINSGTYLLYDGACGTGGMLTVAEETLQQLAKKHGKQVATHLYGQEINAETYAICKADLLLKGEGDDVEQMLRSKPIIDAINSSTFGAKMPRADWQFVGGMSVPLPPLPEQSAIVRFLDHADRRIRRYIHAKQKLIKLLEEQKQAIIHRAVTRGLESNVRLKPSGVEWLGEVPEHWHLLPLKRACSLLRDGTHLPPARQAEGFPLLSVRNIVGDLFVHRSDDSRISEAHFKDLCRSFTLRRDDVVLAIVGATIGKVAIVPEMEPFQIQRSLAVLRPRARLLDFRFLAAFLRGPGFQRALWTTVAFSAQPGIYLNRLGSFYVAIPPIVEQQAIIDELEKSTAHLSRAISSAHREISLLREYRTRLIADVVTGKLDVRETAAGLPDETEEPEPLDEADALTDAEEDAVDDLDAVPDEAEA